MSHRKFNNKYRLCNCSSYEKHFEPVQAGLSLTPKDVRDLSSRGIPVSTQNLGIVVDNDVPEGYLPLEYRRGVDLNTTWEASQKAKSEILRNYRISKRLNKDK